jgi:hypothetical protein
MKLTVDELYAKYLTAKQEADDALRVYTAALEAAKTGESPTAYSYDHSWNNLRYSEQVMRDAWRNWQKAKHGPKWGMQ